MLIISNNEFRLIRFKTLPTLIDSSGEKVTSKNVSSSSSGDEVPRSTKVHT